jgi:LmbE family N-acetylglucosaminyl deacetylase
VGSSADRVLVVHAHPDDEVFATAAATIMLAERGANVSLRVGTHTGRAAQLSRSCALLGIGDWDHLAEAGRWIDTGHAGERTLAAERPDVLAAAVRAHVDHLRPATVLTVDRHGLTGHPDHIAVHEAVRIALAMPGWRPRAAWGALLLRRDVLAAHALAAGVLPHRTVGSGRVHGRADDAVEHVMTCSPDGADRRRTALDQYTPGLGTMPHGEMARRLDRLGDSVLLRLARDAGDWHTDRFESIPF